jgi:hypothetical protein
MGIFITLLLYAAMAVLSDLLAPPPDDAKPAGLEDFKFPTATEGRSLPLLWGTRKIAGPNVIWYGDYLQEPIIDEVGLFFKKEFVTGYRYYLGKQMAICQGEATELISVDIGDKQVFSGSVAHGGTFTINEPKLFGGDELGNGGVVGTLQFFAGTSTQTASAYLSQFQKEPPVTGDTPAYRDCCYIAPETEAVYLGNSTSIKPWKFEVRRTPNPLGLTSNRHVVNSGDANGVNVLYECLTNAEYGFAIPAADVNSAVWITAANTTHTEGNGFSFMLERVEDIGDMVRRLEKQLDAFIYLNPITGKWDIKLVRDDYDVLLVPELTLETNIRDVRGFTRGTWEGTKNQVRVPFVHRDDSYKSTYAFAQDMANMRIVGKTTSTAVTHEGIADPDLADAICWRELRTHAIPLASGEFLVDRTLYGVLPGDVVAFTNPDVGFVRLPMRVTSVDYGDLLNGTITLKLVQDIFRSAVGSFGAPPQTGWSPPADTLVAFPSDEQLAFEAPRAFTARDPFGSSATADKVYAAARKQGAEVAFRLMERHSAGTPSGAFTEVGQVYGFARIGELASALPAGSAYPQSSITITPTPDTQTALEIGFPDITDLVTLGTDLTTLCMVGNEFLLVSSAQTSGANVQINNVYRGVLDSVQEDHASGAPVFLLFLGGGISDSGVPAGQNVHVKLLPISTTDELAEGSATQIAFAMANRTRRPYPPSELSLNGTRFDDEVALEGGAGSGEDTAIDLTFKRRDFRTENEVAALLTDAASIDPSYPSENSTTHEVDVIDDPDGLATLLFTQALGSSAAGSITRLDILQATGGALPTRLRFALRATHTFEGTGYDSRYDLVWDFDVTSALTGQFAFGALDTNDVSAAFTVDDDSNDHDFVLSSAFTAGDVQYRINGGAFANLITAGGTTGTILAASLTNGDTIEIRHTSTDVGAQKLIAMADGAAAAFGVLYV